jgi:D-alanyl-D-alanine carboxypeptidase (penicillin-binding protein 5/6)
MTEGGIAAEVTYASPLAAPLSAGQEVGELVIPRAGLPEVRVPLVAETDVPEGGFGVRVQTALRVLVARLFPGFAAAQDLA